MRNQRRSRKYYKQNKTSPEVVVVVPKIVAIPSIISVKELSEVTKLPVVNIVSELMKSGVLAAINDSIDYDTAVIVCDDLGVKCEPLEAENELSEEVVSAFESNNSNLLPRPPIVTIMGHVDHGKTTLLDKIRSAHVVDSESGGITQHISAYQIKFDSSRNKNFKNKIITFIDTPGHAAFSALRSHGAAITDIVVLIVAANDGVKPQTVEVIEQCQKHNVPIIVAINKVDLPDADALKVKQQLSEHNLLTEEWGGKTLVSEISAKTDQGIDQLLEIILLQAEMMDLRANPKENAFGVVIESHMHKGAGPLALILVKNGTLHRGDAVQIGSTWGRARILEDYNHQSIESAPPGMPARIAGIRELPSFGEHLIVFNSEKEAREATSRSMQRNSIKATTAKKLLDENDAERHKNLELRIIIKADVKGSLEAIKKLISEINTYELVLKIIGEGIGAISESDITLAKATKSEVFAFRVPTLISAKNISQKEKIMIKSYQVIYELVDEIKSNLTSMLAPLVTEEVLASGEILAVFRDDKKGFVAGGKLTEGKISKNSLIKIIRNDEIIWSGKITSLRREKSEANEISSGVEFGFALEIGAIAAAADKFQVYQVIETARKIE